MRERINQLAPLLIMLVIAIAVFGLQTYNVGFWGIRHGWTSSHGLAMMTKAEPDNSFVGYSMGFYKPDGTIDYVYFDRYPVVFSVVTNAFLRLFDDLPTQIYAARQYMNAIFLLTVVMAYVLVRNYVRNGFLALAIVLWSSSSFYLLYYKDMIHYDQPALLGLVGLLVAITLYKKNSPSLPAERGLGGEVKFRLVIYITTLIAVILGRGYASFFVLGVWFVVDAVQVLFNRNESTGTQHVVSLPQRFKSILRLDALWVTVISVIWSATWLFYNVVTESRLREVSITETSIVDSALRRIPLVEASVSEQARVNVANTGLSSWFTFIGLQLERAVSWALPVRIGRELGFAYEPDAGIPSNINPALVIVGLLMIAVVIVFIVRQRSPHRDITIIATVSGWLWLLVMINLAATHEYVTMYLYPFTLMVYTALFSWIDNFRTSPLVSLSVNREGTLSHSDGSLPSPAGEGLGKGVSGLLALRPVPRIQHMMVGALLLMGLGMFSASLSFVALEQQEEIEQGAVYTYDYDRILKQIDGEHRNIHFTYPNTCVVNNWQCHALGYYLGDNYIMGSHRTDADYVVSYFPYVPEQPFLDEGESMTVLVDTLTPQNEITYLFDASNMVERTAPPEDALLYTVGDALTLQAVDI